jgi:phosphomannomutase/phosphoglucomutase
VVKGPLAEERLREMFKAVDGVLRENPEVGEYNQTM